MDPSRSILIKKVKSLQPRQLNQLISLFKRHGWRTTEQYVNDFLQISQNYIYIIEYDSKLISTVFFANYENRIWIGHSYTVDTHRGKGLNSLIKKHIMEEHQNIPLFLSCRDDLVNLNTKLGFKNSGYIFEIQIKLKGTISRNSNPSAIQSLLNFDRDILGGNRDEKLLTIMNSRDAQIFLRQSENKVDSYALVSNINGGFRIGPLVSGENDSGLELLSDLISHYRLPVENLSIFTHQQHLDSIMKFPGSPEIKNKLNLLSTGDLKSEIKNQILLFGRASG